PGGRLARDNERGERVEAPRDVRSPGGDEAVVLGPTRVRRQRDGVGAITTRVADEDTDAHAAPPARRVAALYVFRAARREPMEELSGRVAVVTGGAGGIGKGIA